MDTGDKYLGRILDNRYEIMELIGVGGMAYVYKALCHRLNRLVAIKILKEELASDEEFQRRFYSESQAVAMLSHPNIVAVYDVSRSGNTEYIVMELIEGITLKQYINRKGLLSWKEALHFTTQIVKALSHAHSRGIIHRDIKPHNIMILKDGSVKVADFGIARMLSVQNTLTQEALGSVHYISPEQAKGGQIDARSDIYSVGVVMYEMLTSRLPFVGESAVSVAIQHISAIPLLPRDINPDIPIGLEEITMHAMEPDVNMRFTTAEEMQRDLDDFRKNPGIIFNYAIPNSANRPSAGVVPVPAPYETRVIPRADMRTQPPLNPRPKPEMSGDEYRESKKRSTSTATLVGIFSVVVVLLVLLFVFVIPTMNEWFNPPDESIVIENFVGQRLDDILANEDYAEIYQFEYSFESSDTVLEGFVISQNPSANRPMRQPLGTDRITVRLVVSEGPDDEPPIEMPDLIGRHLTEARNALRALDFDLVVEDQEVPSDEPRGNVVETFPPARSMLRKGDSVLLSVSAGPEDNRERVPDLIGQPESEVITALRDLGFNPEVTGSRYDSVHAAGRVVFIQHLGTMQEPGTRIELRVSLGPEPTPTPTPSPDPTPTPTPTPTPIPSPDPGDPGDSGTDP